MTVPISILPTGVPMTDLPSSITVNGSIYAVQWHHIINGATFRDSQFLRLLEARGLWSQESVTRNLIPLAGSVEAATAIGSSRHTGGHAPYNGFVKSVIAAFDDALRARNFGGLTEQQWLEQSAKKIDGHHLWQGTLEQFATRCFCSDILAGQIRRAGLSDLWLTHCDEV